MRTGKHQSAKDSYGGGNGPHGAIFTAGPSQRRTCCHKRVEHSSDNRSPQRAESRPMRSQTNARRVLKPVALKTGIASIYFQNAMFITTDFPVCKPTGSPTWGTHRSEDRNLASIKHTFIEVAQWKRGGPISTFCFFDRGRRSAAGDASLHGGRDATYELRFARVPLGRGPPTATRRRFIFIFRLLTVEIGRGHSHLPNAQEVGWSDGHRSTVRGIAMATPL